MTMALVALGAACIGFIAGSYYEYARSGGSLDLSGRLGDARRELARRKAADLAESESRDRDDATMARLLLDMREQS